MPHAFSSIFYSCEVKSLIQSSIFWEQYSRLGVVSDGFILLDLRRRKADAGIEGLSALGSVDVIEEAAYGSA
ncbi:hypothetical protein, partial [Cochlodiniinecator piscidefendens]|uniref:hypothetical protein n=1 Tax=Cochlodiniinecator piscidefendens TaxID=2715756 RepID=UPI00197B3C8E